MTVSVAMNSPMLPMPGDFRGTVMDNDPNGASDAMALEFKSGGKTYGASAFSPDAAALALDPGSDAWGDGTRFVFTDKSGDSTQTIGVYLIDSDGKAVPQSFRDGNAMRRSPPVTTQVLEHNAEGNAQLVASTFKFPDGSEGVMKTWDRHDAEHFNGTELTIRKPADAKGERPELSFASENCKYDESMSFPANFDVRHANITSGPIDTYAFFEAQANPALPQAFDESQLHPEPRCQPVLTPVEGEPNRFVIGCEEPPAAGWFDTVKSWFN
jgi:hypothetical protein